MKQRLFRSMKYVLGIVLFLIFVLWLASLWTYPVKACRSYVIQQYQQELEKIELIPHLNEATKGERLVAIRRIYTENLRRCQELERLNSELIRARE